ncbi:hypothetical protein GCM10009799_30980 [Nocardiopsis rhodophaea]|uniref:Uncharacterized protein n=1 Tax=Nocardiopsis rhodophaea TaxID=280238 RepID=A0ABN2T8E0_9ACTN
MRTVLALVVAAVVWLLGTTLLAIGVPGLATVEQLESTSGRLAWFALPQFVLMFAMVLLAALTLGRGQLRSLLGTLVVLAPPVVALLAAAAIGAAGDVPGIVIVGKFVCGALGAGAACWLALPPKEPAVFPRP